MPTLYNIVQAVQNIIDDSLEKIEKIYITGSGAIINNIDLFITYLNNNTFVINWINEIKNFEQFTDKMYEQIKYEWNEYCLSNDVYIEDEPITNRVEALEKRIKMIERRQRKLAWQRRSR